ncbi:MAG TPA: efflux RND transporter periplasmic adaptor subunit [Candidatus Pacearchaeota archaeon]|nr:efflux RND transporter periplasmic adaptor subunit [Candidatus Pacearchaeota archaeon]
MKFFDFFNKLKPWQKTLFVVLFIIVLASILKPGKKGNTQEFATVSRMDLVQIASVTGKVQPTKVIDMAFKTSGIISKVYVSSGDQVKTGQVLISLENANLIAQQKQAQAQIDGQMAKLQELKLGGRAEDIAVSQSSLDKAEIDLQNYYKTSYVTLNEAFNTVDNIFRKQINTMFDYSPYAIDKYDLDYFPCDASIRNSLNVKREVVDEKMLAWQKDIDLMSNNNLTNEQFEKLISESIDYMYYFQQFLTDLNKTMIVDCALDLEQSTKISSFKPTVATVITSFNTSFSTVKTLKQTIDAQNQTVRNYENQLALKKAGGTSEQVAYQESQIKSAQANLELIQSQIADTYIVSPINGIITLVDIDSGEVATAGKNYVSMISSDPFEIEAYINETDIAKVAVGNEANITFDAFGSKRQFHGKIIKIDPAQTIVEGVVSYKATFQITDFSAEIKSGMTADIDIITAERQNVLAVPSRSIIKKQGKAFVRIKRDNKEEEIEIQTGIKGDNGNTEIIDGLSEGQKILVN